MRREQKQKKRAKAEKRQRKRKETDLRHTAQVFAVNCATHVRGKRVLIAKKVFQLMRRTFAVAVARQKGRTRKKKWEGTLYYFGKAISSQTVPLEPLDSISHIYYLGYYRLTLPYILGQSFLDQLLVVINLKDLICMSCRFFSGLKEN